MEAHTAQEKRGTGRGRRGLMWTAVQRKLVIFSFSTVVIYALDSLMAELGWILPERT